MKILSVVGARPNFMKIAPLIHAINQYNNKKQHSKIKHVLVHTGQHYDDNMSKVFFKSLNIPEADIHLNIGSGTHAMQVGKTMIEFETVLKNEKPDWVIVLGDVNATLACSVTAKKEKIRVCHIEAGLRSNDMSMPEEINRIVTDSISDLLLTPDKLSSKNLLNEGKEESKIHFVGNIMIDTLEANKEIASQLHISQIIQNNLINKNSNTYKQGAKFSVVTMHRPSNVDDKSTLSDFVDFFNNTVSTKTLIMWPVHPRTQKQLVQMGLWESLEINKNVIMLNPLNYHEMLKLNMEANVFFTDSGGLQEECCVVGTPCITLRENTERPITLSKNGGVSILVGSDINKISKEFEAILDVKKSPKIPNLWDGKTAERCLDILINNQ